MRGKKKYIDFLTFYQRQGGGGEKTRSTAPEDEEEKTTISTERSPFFKLFSFHLPKLTTDLSLSLSFLGVRLLRYQNQPGEDERKG